MGRSRGHPSISRPIAHKVDTPRARDIPLPPSYTPTLSHLPAARPRENASLSLTRSTPRLDGRRPCRVHPAGVWGTIRLVRTDCLETENAWQSPELRESMERARAWYLQRRVQRPLRVASLAHSNAN
ncbi:hypothetical protein L210DRAFT_2606124 [Boletus edulis BED1]|uniref:Uncharacterized protein n=1 Tax=Boletus edulis BED1 TaxID=1328754 RepID=A0AAD4BBF1_BOLED|nr:hypothetical protein L210DRAFT_2606124 [Boletus edulis BED1]